MNKNKRMNKNKAEIIGFEADSFGIEISDDSGIDFKHGCGEGAKIVEIYKRVAGYDEKSWTKALLKLRKNLLDYVVKIDELLK